MATSNVTPQPSRGDALISRALVELDKRLRNPGEQLSSPDAVSSYLRLSLGRSDVERFFVLYLDTQNRLLAAEEASRGTVKQTPVFPREIARRSLQLNATNVILAHNHPSGSVDPSDADWGVTSELKRTLWLVDVMVLDHFIVTELGTTSMRSQRRWIEEFPDDIRGPTAEPASKKIAPADGGGGLSKDEKYFLHLVKSVPPEARRYVLRACQAAVDEALRARSTKQRSSRRSAVDQGLGRDHPLATTN